LLVPPQPTTCGLEDGKSQSGWPPSWSPSSDRLSPLAAKITDPWATASAHAWSKDWQAALPQESSDAPHEMLIVAHPSSQACLTAAANPASVFGAK
jgi:hypothetical protein